MPLPSPTITSAVKLKRRPPLTTLETRLIATTRPRWCLFSPPSRPRPPRSSRRPRPSRFSPRLSPRLSDLVAPLVASAIMVSFHWISRSSSELQPAFTRGVGQSRDPPAVGVSAAVEHHGVDPCGFGPLGDELDDPHAVGLLVAVHRAHVGLA